MTIEFVVEDGTGKSDATSYVSENDMKQYWHNIGYDYGSLSEDDIKRYLNRSSSLIDSKYLTYFPGVRSYEEQTLEWPRYGAMYIGGQWPIKDYEVPIEIRNATCEMAYVISNGYDVQPVLSSSGDIVEEEVEVDVIKERKVYKSSSIKKRDVYTVVEDALARITGGTHRNYTVNLMRE